MSLSWLFYPLAAIAGAALLTVGLRVLLALRRDGWGDGDG